jgi:hypothetical protein
MLGWTPPNCRRHLSRLSAGLTTALDKSETLQRRLADYHKASPELAHWLARWQSDDAKT